MNTVKKQGIKGCRFLVGVTGNFGSGKSEVTNFFRNHFNVIFLDSITHELLKNRNIKKKLSSIFGTSNPDELKKIVFKNKSKRGQLEKIMHPEIKKIMISRLKNGVNIVEIPLLFEAGWEEMFDFTVLVYTPVKIIVKRLKKKAVPLSEIKLRLKSQLPDRFKFNRVNLVINNSGSFYKTKKILEVLLYEFKKIDSMYRRLPPSLNRI